MAAAIRHAARRIGGGAFQRSVERPARLFNTKALTADDKKDAAIRMVLIDRKAEELYNHVAGFKAKYILKGSEGQKYTTLMNQLSVHIKPRHDDPTWRSCRRWALVHGCVKHAGGFLIGYVAADASLHWYKERNP